MIFQERNRTEGIYWSQLEIDAPHILQLRNSVKKNWGSRVYNIAVVFGTDNEAIVFDQGKFAQGSGQGCGGMD